MGGLTGFSEKRICGLLLLRAKKSGHNKGVVAWQGFSVFGLRIAFKGQTIIMLLLQEMGKIYFENL